MRKLIAAGTCLFTVALFLNGCNEETQAETAVPPTVDVVSARVNVIKHWDKYNGRIAATEEVDILPRVGGYITEVNYKEGNDVKKGDLLFTIDQRPYRALLASAKAQLEQSLAALVFAKQQHQRAEQLIKGNAISHEEVQQKRTAYDQKLAEVHAAESAVTTASLQLEFTEIRSPIDGKTSSANFKAGNLAVANTSLMTTVVSQNPVYVYFDPDENSAVNYQKLMKTSSITDVRVGLSSDNQFPYRGTLTFVDNRVNAATGTIRVRATVPNTDKLLTPGLYANVELSVGEPVSVIQIPERAILTDQDKKYVYVVDENNNAKKRYILPGKLYGKLRIIRNGISAGERVIVSGFQQIYASGTPVSPNPVREDEVVSSSPVEPISSLSN